MSSIRPLTGQVLIEVLPPDDKTHGGLFLPDIAHDRIQGEKAKPCKGRVVAIGPWRKTKTGFAILPDFWIGALVVFTPYAGVKVGKHLGERHQLVRIDDVLAVLANPV